MKLWPRTRGHWISRSRAADRTVGQLVAHLVGAERRWTLGRLYGEGPPPRYEDEPAIRL